MAAAVPILTKKGREKFCHNGYMYVFDRRSADGATKFWRCELKMEKCRARLHTNADTGIVLREVGGHLHGENAAKVEVAEALMELFILRL